MRFVMYKTQGTGRGRAGSQWNRSCPGPAALQPNLLGFSLAVWFVGLSVRRWTSILLRVVFVGALLGFHLLPLRFGFCPMKCCAPLMCV